MITNFEVLFTLTVDKSHMIKDDGLKSGKYLKIDDNTDHGEIKII